MISRSRLAALTILPAVFLCIETACQRVPLLAPSGSVITLSASTTVLPFNGITTITGQLIEAAGTPPHSGTHVTFTTTLGTIQPSDAETDASGLVTVRFIAGVQSGTATITAISGGASVSTAGALKILVGSAAVGRVNVSASPATVPAAGGSTTISASVLDVNGNILPGVPVSFSTTSGTLGSAVVNTDPSGLAQTLLTTSTTATVTASVGAQGSTTPSTGTGGTTGTTPSTTTSGQASGTVTVPIASAPTLVVTPPTTAPTAGIPASFTFVVTAAAQNGSAIRELSVDWGDTTVQSLGAVTGNATVTHIFAATGTYVVTGILTDASGNTVRVSTIVFVQVAPPLGVTLTSTQVTSGLNTIVSFTATVTGLGNAVVQSYSWVFGDGQNDVTTTNQTSHNYTTAVLPKTAVVTITTSTGATAIAQRTISP